MKILAIDPGVAGGMAIREGEKVLAIGFHGDDEQTAFLIREWKPNIAYMELVGGYIGKEQPGSRMFVFGDAFGLMRGMLAMAQIPLKLIQPKQWIRGVLPGSLGLDYDVRKRALKQYSQEIYPELEVTLKTADALALLEYARRAEGGEFRPVSKKPVANTSGIFRKDAAQAVAWAKSQKFEVPKKNSKEFIQMVNYWAINIKT